MVLTLFTNDPVLARHADQGGVNRIGLDLERIGKADRQSGRNNWVSDHKLDELSNVSTCLKNASLFLRTNPMHESMRQEVDDYIAAGVEVLMLPMVRSAQESAKFLEYVDARAVVSLLVETPEGATRLHEIVKLDGIGDIHIGLNDMRLAMGLRNHFEVLASDVMDCFASTVHDAGIPFGFGGIGRVDDHTLPVPPRLIYAQYARLNASRALVSRVFTYGVEPANVATEIALSRHALSDWYEKDVNELNDARETLRRVVSELSAE